MNKCIMLILGICMGGATTAVVLWHQIENRYEIGYTAGYTDAGLSIATYLSNHVNHKKDLEPLLVKYMSITPIEEGGVRTFEVIE